MAAKKVKTICDKFIFQGPKKKRAQKPGLAHIPRMFGRLLIVSLLISCCRAVLRKFDPAPLIPALPNYHPSHSFHLSWSLVLESIIKSVNDRLGNDLSVCVEEVEETLADLFPGCSVVTANGPQSEILIKKPVTATFSKSEVFPRSGCTIQLKPSVVIIYFVQGQAAASFKNVMRYIRDHGSVSRIPVRKSYDPKDEDTFYEVFDAVFLAQMYVESVKPGSETQFFIESMSFFYPDLRIEEQRFAADASVSVKIGE